MSQSSAGSRFFQRGIACVNTINSYVTMSGGILVPSDSLLINCKIVMKCLFSVALVETFHSRILTKAHSHVHT